jgi:carboxymethylenebutenolidase
VIHDSEGLNDHIRDIARRAAKSGYMAIAPDWRSRLTRDEGPNDAGGDPPAQTLTQISASDMAIDIADTVQYLDSTAMLQNGKAGAVGFGWGGAQALLAAAAAPVIAASTVFYGDISSSIPLISPKTAPVLGIFAGGDTGINAHIPALEAALKNNNVAHEIRRYAGVRDGFHDNAWADRFDADAARDAWTRTIAHFDKYLKM